MVKQYFTHDYNSRIDPKLLKLRKDYGMEGVGVFWCVIEMLFEQGGYIKSDEIDAIAFDLRVEEDMLKNILTKYDLFNFKDNLYFSNGVLKRLAVSKEKTEKAIKAAEARWDKNQDNKMQTQCDRNANAMQTQCDRNAIKLNKTKLNTQLVNNIFNNYKSASACLRVRERNEKEREPYKKFFNEFYKYKPLKEEDANEIIDTIIEARDQACTSEGLKFNKKTYYGNDFASLISSLDSENLGQVFKSIHFKEKGEIQNRPVYILSALIQQAEQKKRGGK